VFKNLIAYSILTDDTLSMFVKVWYLCIACSSVQQVTNKGTLIHKYAGVLFHETPLLSIH